MPKRKRRTVAQYLADGFSYQRFKDYLRSFRDSNKPIPNDVPFTKTSYRDNNKPRNKNSIKHNKKDR